MSQCRSTTSPSRPPADEFICVTLGLSFDALANPEKLALHSRMERNLRRAPSVEHRLVGALAVESSPTDLGGSSPADVLATRLRIPKGEARRRIATPSCSGRAGH